ncbi:SDR family oxidoreductase [Pseudahrensia aquimaris]|uniref:SDR family oxidoreductase n=1 Tax=Pseudahrensia aquimaris TaxID=744461 RepID=A0ABW3FED0_9HYPH
MFDPAKRNADTTTIITGGTQGLGFAVAEQLMVEGATRFALAARSEDKGEAAAGELRKRGADAIFIPADMAVVEDCTAMVEKAVAHFGTVNGLVNAAANTERGTLLNTSVEFYDKVMAINTRGPFFTMQAFVRHCLDAGHPGRIVNILSTERHCGQPFLCSYAASKAALGVFTKNVAHSHRHDRINCNAVAPGWMDTPQEHLVQTTTEGKPENWLEMAEKNEPFGQLIKPPEIAGLISYLLSPQIGVMTGAILDHDQQVMGAPEG